MPLTRLRPLMQLALLVAVVSGLQQACAARQRAEQAVVDAGLGATLATLARPGDIRMLSSDMCPSCAAARQWLTSQAVPFSECSIERDTECRATFEATRAPGTPVLLVRGQSQLGFSPERVRQVLALPR